MEIARRRQQIEENACLHDELTRLAKLRETAEITDRLNQGVTAPGYGVSPGISPAVAAAAASAAALGHHHNPHHLAGPHLAGGVHGGGVMRPGVTVDSTSSVLKSVDEILRDGIGATPALGMGPHVTHNDPYALRTGGYGGTALGGTAGPMMNSTGYHHDPYHTTGGVGVGPNPHGVHHMNNPHHPSTAFDRVTDFSPINSDMSDMGQYNRYGGAGRAGAYGPPAPAGPHHHPMAHGYDATGRLNPGGPRPMMPHTYK